MGDLKWITIGFVRNFLTNVCRDEFLTYDERKYFKDSAHRLIKAIKTASNDVEEESYHRAFHNLRGRVLAAKLIHHMLVRNNKST